jgi:hypothetical protein
MRKYVLTLAVLAAAPLLLAMPGNAQQANSVVAAGAVPLSDEEMDNVSAAGLGDWVAGLFGKDRAPGQKLRALRNSGELAGATGAPGQQVKAWAHEQAPGQQLQQAQINAQGGPGNSDFGRSHRQNLLANTQGGPGNSAFGLSQKP